MKEITDATIEALSRNFFKEANSYGFKYEHYLKFVNTLLDLTLSENIPEVPSTEDKQLIKYDEDIDLPITSDKLGIRNYDGENDLKLIKKWLKDEYGKYFLHSLITSATITIEDLLTNPKSKFGIVTFESKPIGLMAFLNLDTKQKKAELRKMIGESDMRGKGLGKEAAKLWINYGRNKLKLRKIYLYTIDTNIRNVRLNEELGFKVEGILRNEVVTSKKIFDVLRMGLLFK